MPVDIIDCKRFSRLLTLEATIVRVFRAVKRMTQNITVQLNHRRWEDIELESPLTAQELQAAEVILVIQEKTKASEEIDEMSGSLNVYEDEQHILRCRGPLQNARFPESTINPILLPKTSSLTKLTTLHAHKQSGYSGASQTLA
ncbi:hypothetical protein AB6A40_010116 [Gnathostoma spinigerum]|uniref:Uncharacterized protein n=1 Tax=Gnathostoma spinigerum TaxID=75299 RepID=A0ABD6F245_9BILA